MRRNVGLNWLPAPADGTPCGSWQEAHSTMLPLPLSYRRTSWVSARESPSVSNQLMPGRVALGGLKSMDEAPVGKVTPTGWSLRRSVPITKMEKSVAPAPTMPAPRSGRPAAGAGSGVQADVHGSVAAPRVGPLVQEGVALRGRLVLVVAAEPGMLMMESTATCPSWQDRQASSSGRLGHRLGERAGAELRVGGVRGRLDRAVPQRQRDAGIAPCGVWQYTQTSTSLR